MDVKTFFQKLGKHWKLALLIFLLGAGAATWTCLACGTKSVAKLKSDLSSAQVSLAEATSRSTELAGELQAVSVQLGAANTIIASQKSTINGLHSSLGAGQLVVDNINDLITVAGSDFSKQLEAFTAGFEELYKVYN